MHVFIDGWTSASEIPWIAALCGSDYEVWQSLELLWWLFGIILEGQTQETKQENQWSPSLCAT